MAKKSHLIDPSDVSALNGAVIIDCRFSLTDPAGGEGLYRKGHIPGAYYMSLDRDMSSPVGRHGGRHPLPPAERFVALLASMGVGPATPVIAYDDSRMAFATRLWWMMKSLGFRPPLVLNGGYQAWVSAGGVQDTAIPHKEEVDRNGWGPFTGHCDISGLRALQSAGCMLIDSREEKRYQGLEEPIDPVAGHIPGALNQPWQNVTNTAGEFLSLETQRERWGDRLEAEQLVVYCGSGVTACVNLFSLSTLGRDDALLYSGSWSDWCSYL